MSERETPKDTCAAKIAYTTCLGTQALRLCGQECEYLTPERHGVRYSGWYHMDGITDHHAVPKRWVS